jgi:6-phosphofructokinase
VNDIHKRGGTVLGTSRGGHDTAKIVDCLQDRGINQVYIIGGDGTQKGASVIYEVTHASRRFWELLLDAETMCDSKFLKHGFRKSGDGVSSALLSVSQRLLITTSRYDLLLLRI